MNRLPSSIQRGPDCIAAVNGVCYSDIETAAQHISNTGGALIILQDIVLSDFTLEISRNVNGYVLY